MVQLLKENLKSGHMVMEVKLKKEDRYVMIDPDYGAMVKDKLTNKFLSIKEIAIKKRKKIILYVENIANKSFPGQAYYNDTIPFNFAWNPSRSRKKSTLKKIPASFN